MEKVVAVAAALLFLASEGTHAMPPADCGKTSVRYFSWAALKTYPPRPTDPESEAWAKEQEANGAAYYVAEYCKDGRIVSLTKRLNKADFFRYDYSYEGSKLTELWLTGENGKARKVGPRD